MSNKYVGYVPNPDMPGYLKRDVDAYLELLDDESKKRREFMNKVIQSRI